MKQLISLVALASATSGCALRAPATAHVADDDLCGAPSRVVVAEFEGDDDLRNAATNYLASDLEKLGFSVLAPRHPPPKSPLGKPPPVDWVFGGDVRRREEAGLELKVDIQSLLDRRRVWAIVDALPEDTSGSSDEVLRRTVRTALTKFEFDVLGCRESRLR